jgi:hypothetical protein
VARGKYVEGLKNWVPADAMGIGRRVPGMRGSAEFIEARRYSAEGSCARYSASSDSGAA